MSHILIDYCGAQHRSCNKVNIYQLILIDTYLSIFPNEYKIYVLIIFLLDIVHCYLVRVIINISFKIQSVEK